MAKLQDRDHELLEFVMRYRIATREVLHRNFFSDSELNAVTKVTSKLVERHFLARHPFIGQASYFTLGTAGAKHFGAPFRSSLPLGPQSLLTQFGLLEYCNAPGVKRTRLRVRELQQKYQAILQKGVEAANYVLDATVIPTRFQFVRVDGGGTADHALRKLRNALACRLKNPICGRLIADNRFDLACVTCSKERADEIRVRVEEEKFPCPVVLFVLPELTSLLKS